MQRVGRTRYPGFVFGLPLGAHEIPIFAYHDVDPEDFGRDLSFLRDNGYRTLTADDLVKHQDGCPGDRVALLTFDDARRNFWEVAFPLLRQFEERATLFAPTFWIGNPSGPSLDGEPEAKAGREPFMTWEQLRACKASGLVDVQAHGHRHALVHTSSRLAGFATPSLLADRPVFDWPMRRAGGRDLLGRPPLGTPVYEATPLLSADRRMVENEAVTLACVEHVVRRGGAAWFADEGWRQELAEVHETATRARRGPSRIPIEEFDRLLESEIRLMVDRFTREMGQPPRYLAYPWMLGSRRSVEVAAGVGIEAVFGVGFDFRRARHMSGPVPAFGRTKGEWLRFLPGRGRSDLASVLQRKVGQFFREQHLAH